MKKPVAGLALGLFALFFMLSSAAWAVNANEPYRVGADVGSALKPPGALLSSNEDNKQTLYTPLNVGAADGTEHEHTQFTALSYDTEKNAPCVGMEILKSKSIDINYSANPVACYILPAGEYYLSEDILLDKPIAVNEGTVNLCLNGHTITYAESANPTYGIIYVYKNATLNLYDCPGTGKITGGYAIATSLNFGGGVYVCQNGVFNMYGGNITGNKAQSGGGVYNNGTFNMHGGTIDKNSSGVDTSNAGQGGGVFTAGTFNMSGGEIINNYATSSNNNGAGVYINSGSFNLSGGDIKGNITNKSGGGIYISSGNLTITGGRIIENKAYGINSFTIVNGGGGIYIGTSGKLYLKGGKITGNETSGKGGGIYNNNSVFVSGAPVVSGNTQNNYKTVSNVYLPENKVINIESSAELQAGAKIGVATYTKPGAATSVNITDTNAQEEYLKYFALDDEVASCHLEVNESGNIVLKTGVAAHNHTVATSENIQYAGDGAINFSALSTAIGSTTSSLGKDGQINNYYLDKNVGLENSIEIKGTVNLCLNGHKIYRQSSDLFNILTVSSGATLNICDCEPNYENSITESGKTINFQGGLITGGAAYNGGCIYLSEGIAEKFATLNFYGGNIVGNKAQDTSGGNGGGIYMANYAKFNMYGGAIKNNDSISTTVASATGKGGGVYIKGTGAEFCMSGGAISDNTVGGGGDGGGVYVGANAKFSMSGDAKIESNVGDDGGVCVAGTLELSGNPYIYGNTNNNTGSINNVCLYKSTGKIIIGTLGESTKIGITPHYNLFTGGVSSVEIIDNNVKEEYLNYFSVDDAAIYHLSIESNKLLLNKGLAPHKHPLNIGCENITEGKEPVEFAHRLSFKNNSLYVDDTPKGIERFTDYSGAGTISAYCLAPGNYYLDTNLELTAPLVFSAKNSSDKNINLCLHGHTIKLIGTAKNSVIYVLNSAVLNLADCNTEKKGTITGGNATAESIANGGGIHINNGILNMYGGNITGNTAGSCGGGIYNLLGTVKMYGGTIFGNTLTDSSSTSGGGIFNSLGNLEMHGGTISGATAVYGGGIYSDTTFKMSGGKITGNIANNQGAGLYLSGDSLTISGGSIENNTATNYGGGIYFDGTLYLQGGEITGNKINNDVANNNGAGIYGETIHVSGAPKVYGNTKGTGENLKPQNIYLEYSDVINIEDAGLSSEAKLGVTTKVEPTEGNPVNITNDKAQEGYLSYFVSDDNYDIALNAEKNVLQLVAVSTVIEHTHTADGMKFTTETQLENNLTTGSYYLKEAVNLGTDTVNIAADATVNLCLNGKVITTTDKKPVFKVPANSVLHLYNCQGTGGFAGLAKTGGIEVAPGGTVLFYDKDGNKLNDYAPTITDKGGTVTVGADGTITVPDEGSSEQPVDKDHAGRHKELANATELTESNIADYMNKRPAAGYNGTLPDVDEAYYYLDAGQYYLSNDFTLSHALVVLGKTDFCLNGSNLGADNDKWLYEMQHVFWVPEKAVLDVLDCQRNLHIIWLYGGRVFLKNGGQVNITGKDGWQTEIKADDNGNGGQIKVEPGADNKPVMTLPENTKLTQKDNEDNVTQIITNNNGVLEVKKSESGETTKIAPPVPNTPVTLTMPDDNKPDIVLEAPAKSVVQTENQPEITLEQPGKVQPDGTVSSPEVTVKPTETGKEPVNVTAPEDQNVQVDTDGNVEAPVDSTIKVGDVEVKVEEIGGGENKVTVDPNGNIETPPESKVVISDSKQPDGLQAEIITKNPEDKISVSKDGVTPPADSLITVSNPGEDGVKLEITPHEPVGEIKVNGNEVTVPKGEVKVNPPNKKDDVTIVIALPDNGGEINVDGDKITPPKGSDVEVKKKDSVTIVIALPWPEGDGEPPHIEFDKDGNPVLPPGTKVTEGDKTTVVTEDKPVLDLDTGELKPEEPGKDPDEDPDKTEELKPGETKTTEDGTEIKREENDKGEEQITIKPADENKPSVIITPQPNPSPTPGEEPPKPPQVDKDGNVYIDEPFKVQTDPKGPEISTDKGGSVTPDGGVKAPGGSTVTIKPTPESTDKTYKVILPPEGGEIRLPADPTKPINLPPGAKVVGPDGKETTISDKGGTLNPATGELTGVVSGGGTSGGSSSGGGGGSHSASYIITASASIGGEISPDKKVTVSRGADQTFVIKPAVGYVISDVLVDGKSVGPQTSYTFKDVRASHTIQALFVAEDMSGHGRHGDCPKDETCPIWPYTDSIPTAWYHDGVHYCIERGLMIGTAPALWEPNIPFSRAMMAQVLYNNGGRPEVSGEGVFADVDKEWYWPAITWGGRNKVLWGYGDGNYGPQDSITREQLATLLWRYSGQPQAGVQLNFSDAAQVSDYAREALCWASQHGVINGYPDGSFRPQGYASRAEAAQMIMRYFNL